MHGEWEKIETAPKEPMAEVLIFEAGVIRVAWRHSDREDSYMDGTTKGFSEDAVLYYPKHWMPLPEPPKEGK